MKKLFFIHIPKCGGKSFRSIMGRHLMGEVEITNSCGEFGHHMFANNKKVFLYGSKNDDNLFDKIYSNFKNLLKIKHYKIINKYISKKKFEKIYRFKSFSSLLSGNTEKPLFVSIIRSAPEMLMSLYNHVKHVDGTQQRGWWNLRDLGNYKTIDEYIDDYLCPDTTWIVPCLKVNPFYQLFDDAGRCVSDIIVPIEKLAEFVGLFLRLVNENNKTIEMPIIGRSSQHLTCSRKLYSKLESKFVDLGNHAFGTNGAYRSNRSVYNGIFFNGSMFRMAKDGTIAIKKDSDISMLFEKLSAEKYLMQIIKEKCQL